MLWIIDMKNERQTRLREEVARVYTEIFREAPWKEDIHPEEIIASMIGQFFRPRKVIALAAVMVGFKHPKVVGFAWMYEIFLDDLEKEVRFSPELKILFSGGKKVFYLQEIGVAKKHRGKGVGRSLIKKLLREGRKNGANIIVLSTNKKATLAKKLFAKVGFQDSGIVRPPKELGRTYWVFKLKN